MSTIAIDPGVGGTGWAYWEEDPEYAPSTPFDTGVLKGRGSWIEQATNIYYRMHDLIDRLGMPQLALIEYPAVFQSAGGRMAAGRGDIVKLAVLTGMLISAVEVCHTVKLVEVNVWKGQLPKYITQLRIQQLLKINDSVWPSHVWDAVGIGLYFWGWKL
jgi:Holliday junction resolvasome RuvABC endonuclease subunit